MVLSNREKDLRRDRSKRNLNTQKRRARNSAYKKNRKFAVGGCVHCGLVIDESNHPEFDWDHIDPATKLYNVCQMSLHSIAMIAREIAKCQLLCAECHSIRTNTEKHQLNRRENVIPIFNLNQLELEL